MNVESVNKTLGCYYEARANCVQFSEERFFFQDSLNNLVRKHVINN